MRRVGSSGVADGEVSKATTIPLSSRRLARVAYTPRPFSLPPPLVRVPHPGPCGLPSKRMMVYETLLRHMTDLQKFNTMGKVTQVRQAHVVTAHTRTSTPRASFHSVGEDGCESGAQRYRFFFP